MILKNKISKEEMSLLPKVKFEGRIIVIHTKSEADKAVEYLMKQPIVGVDTETRPSFVKGQTHKVALLQLSTDELCFLFRLNVIGIPESLIKFFEDPAILKVGLSLKDDFMALRKRAEFSHQSFIELQEYVDSFGIQDKSLQKIYAILFNEKISKSQRLTNWESDVLSDAQKRYAATDAWACYNIYTLLRELEESGEYEIEEITESIEDKN